MCIRMVLSGRRMKGGRCENDLYHILETSNGYNKPSRLGMLPRPLQEGRPSLANGESDLSLLSIGNSALRTIFTHPAIVDQ
jgi:hypothetical protein